MPVKHIYVGEKYHIVKFWVEDKTPDDIVIVKNETTKTEEPWSTVCDSMLAIDKGTMQPNPKVLYCECNLDTLNKIEEKFNALKSFKTNNDNGIR